MISNEALQACFLAQKTAFQKARYPSYTVRMERLTCLKNMILTHQETLAAAIAADFSHRAHPETTILEIFPSLQAIAHAQKHLKTWMKAKRRPVAFWYWPACARVMPQPLGVVGIIVPWNYPLYLAIGPLVGALAAGNRVLIKMSEFTPRTGALLKQLFHQTFADNSITIVTGNAEVGAAFSCLPFDHLLFTGSTPIGKKVMQAASLNLTPVTLELGGKSPTIVGLDYDILRAAEKIAVGKWLNAGQTCVAPDYVFVPETRVDAFIAALKKSLQRFYAGHFVKNPDYSCIIHEQHWSRLQTLLLEAKEKGAKIIPLSDEITRPGTRKLLPHVLLHTTSEMTIMQEEIFGPLLPILCYRALEEVVTYIHNHARPLALYYFGYRRRDIDYILKETHAGGVTINDTLLHVAQEDLPFGGIGASGMGQYHGQTGFNTFSHQKSVFTVGRWNTLPLLYPPFTRKTNWLLKWMVKLS